VNSTRTAATLTREPPPRTGRRLALVLAVLLVAVDVLPATSVVAWFLLRGQKPESGAGGETPATG
jgi:hypothetical protein